MPGILNQPISTVRFNLASGFKILDISASTLIKNTVNGKLISGVPNIIKYNKVMIDTNLMSIGQL